MKRSSKRFLKIVLKQPTQLLSNFSKKEILLLSLGFITSYLKQVFQRKKQNTTNKTDFQQKVVRFAPKIELIFIKSSLFNITKKKKRI